MVEEEAKMKMMEQQEVQNALDLVVTDDEKDEAAYEAWKLREKERIKLYKDLKKALEKGKQARVNGMIEESQSEQRANPRMVSKKLQANDRGRHALQSEFAELKRQEKMEALKKRIKAIATMPQTERTRLEDLGHGRMNKLGRKFSQGRRLPNDLRQKIVEMASNGVKQCDISRSLRVSHACVHKICNEASIMKKRIKALATIAQERKRLKDLGHCRMNKLGRKFTQGRPLSNELRQKIVEMASNGVKHCDIRRSLRVTQKCVWKIWKQYQETGSIRPGGRWIGGRKPRVANAKCEQKSDNGENPSLLSREFRDRLVKRKVTDNVDSEISDDEVFSDESSASQFPADKLHESDSTSHYKTKNATHSRKKEDHIKKVSSDRGRNKETISKRSCHDNTLSEQKVSEDKSKSYITNGGINKIALNQCLDSFTEKRVLRVMLTRLDDVKICEKTQLSGSNEANVATDNEGRFLKRTKKVSLPADDASKVSSDKKHNKWKKIQENCHDNNKSEQKVIGTPSSQVPNITNGGKKSARKDSTGKQGVRGKLRTVDSVKNCEKTKVMRSNQANVTVGNEDRFPRMSRKLAEIVDNPNKGSAIDRNKMTKSQRICRDKKLAEQEASRDNTSMNLVFDMNTDESDVLAFELDQEEPSGKGGAPVRPRTVDVKVWRNMEISKKNGAYETVNRDEKVSRRSRKVGDSPNKVVSSERWRIKVTISERSCHDNTLSEKKVSKDKPKSYITNGGIDKIALNDTRYQDRLDDVKTCKKTQFSGSNETNVATNNDERVLKRTRNVSLPAGDASKVSFNREVPNITNGGRRGTGKIRLENKAYV